MAFALALLACGPGEPERPVRVVLVTLDTLRWDSFVGGDHGPSSMPRLLTRAADGQVFSRFYASTSATQPTHASLFTGLPPWEHGLTRNGQVLGDALETVAERFRDAGFHTAAVVGSFPLHPRFGFSQGFDLYDARFDEAPIEGAWAGHAMEGGTFYSLADKVTYRALRALGSSNSRRQFLWVHYFDPHAPYGDAVSRPVPLTDLYLDAANRPTALPETLRVARQNYERDVEMLDRSIERLLSHIQADAEMETHVLITSDHGESFGEDGSFGHGTRVSPAQVRVPLVILSPGLAPGLRSDRASSEDVAATLLALGGLEPGPIGGRDLTRAQLPPRPILGMRPTVPEPLTEIRADGSKWRLGGVRFFAVDADGLHAGDGTRVWREDREDEPATPAVAARLGPVFQELAARLGETEAPSLVDEETRQGLEALGYVP